MESISLIARAISRRAKYLGGPRRSLVGLNVPHRRPPNQPSTAREPQRVDHGDRSASCAQLLLGAHSPPTLMRLTTYQARRGSKGWRLARASDHTETRIEGDRLRGAGNPVRDAAGGAPVHGANPAVLDVNEPSPRADHLTSLDDQDPFIHAAAATAKKRYVLGLHVRRQRVTLAAL